LPVTNRPPAVATAGVAGDRLGEQAAQGGERRLPADEPGGRGQAQREVALGEGEGRVAGAEPVEIVGEPLAGLVALFRLLGEEPHDDVRQDFREVRVQLGGRDRDPGQVIMHERERVGIAAERRRPGRQLVQRGAECVEIRTMVDRPAGPPGLLGREIGQRAGETVLPYGREPVLGHRRRQLEVDQGGRLVRRRLPVDQRHQDVAGADVAVHHAVPVDRRQDAGQPAGQRDQWLGGPRRRQRRERAGRRVDQEQGVAIALPDRPGDTLDAVEPAQHVALVAEAIGGRGSERLLPDERRRAVGRVDPDNPSAVAVMEDFVAGPHKPLIGRMGSFAEGTGFPGPAVVKRGSAATATESSATMAIWTASTPAKACGTPCGSTAMYRVPWVATPRARPPCWRVMSTPLPTPRRVGTSGPIVGLLTFWWGLLLGAAR
jgi:hypothetical protein